ncbi:protein transport protein Sec61 subunit beta-like [Pistacia vera]|nr:protein transport protein Sec61 subunit beta-like [Pistacia vera]
MTWLMIIGSKGVEGLNTTSWIQIKAKHKNPFTIKPRANCCRRHNHVLNGWRDDLNFRVDSKMALNGGAPPRGSAAAAASMRRRRTTSGGAGASGGAAGSMLQFYTDDAPGLKISPNVVLIMSIGFIAFVAVLHVMGKLYFVRTE